MTRNTEPVGIKHERRMAVENDPQLRGDCDRCHGTGEVMVGEQPNADGTGVKPRYEPCRECEDDELTPEEEHRKAQQSGEVFEGGYRGDGL